ncbi:SdiA-regulated domain-containing protein [Daejeonella lutea]|uniref:SdiA-regulated n=1 Tax=Daejeonella lutea TaxID=572036 RepID=A0A1T5B688_9SPHI|nr:SdiA-regulated domain-containing protein [Daejeonella lutea]SKB42784.1 SdiA-regulated [Daejeonella lutea]
MVDKTPIKIIALIVIPLVLAVVFRFVKGSKDDKTGKGADKTEIKDLLDAKNDQDAKILITWLLPKELHEVSGISWLDANHFACVQDEVGTVFLFNIRDNKIDKEIPFGPQGDYEGISIVGNTIYVLRADGVIFGIENYTSKQRAVKMYKTHLGKKQDSESMAYDKKNNRLLIAVKGADPNSQDYKGIYAFNLATKKMSETPVYKIDLNHEIFKDTNKGKSKNSISPSDIEIHPVTGEIYVLEGTKPKLIIMNTQGAIRSLYKLKGPDFPQPEGLTFGPDGKMYISNEGADGEGNILQVELVDN